MNDIIAEKLKLLPDEPGVYKMYNGSGEIIYVGKAVNLKNRVRQYFQHTPKPPKVEAMVRGFSVYHNIERDRGADAGEQSHKGAHAAL